MNDMDDMVPDWLRHLSALHDREQVDRLIGFTLDRVAGNDMASRRELLFEMYDAEVITRGQARRHGNLAPSDFWDELIAWRQRRQT